MKKKLVVLSGAGISAESGIGTFRASDGLWEKYKIEDVATPEAWLKNRDLVQDFYNQRRKNCINAQPNSAHLDLADLENIFDIHIVTQNIDDLHERAGSSKVLHLHGEIMKSKCSVCADERIWPIIGTSLSNKDKCPLGHQLRPHVVWFGEAVPELDNAAQICNMADVLLIIGTSLNVYPAAGLAHSISDHCQIYLIDPNEVPVSDNKHTHFMTTATKGMLEFRKVIS